MKRLELIKNKIDFQFNKCNKKHFFIRIPKTGSASMNKALSMNWGHYTASFSKSYVGRKAWNNAFTFSIVRNPWAKAYSFYKYCRIHINANPKHKIYKKYNSFESWVKDGMPHHFYDEHEKVLFPKNPHIQFEWISEDNKIIINKYFYLEKINDNIDLLQRLLNSGKSGKKIVMPHINKTASLGEYRKKYNKEMINIVADFCKKDIDFFGYDF